jgi:hypothetical protein
VTRRRYLTVAALAFVLLAGLGGGVVVPAELNAQTSCRATCWEGYGACYKSTNNRQRCQAHLQRCLNGCIRSKKR